MSVDRTQSAVEWWQSREQTENRYDYIMELAQEAGLLSGYAMIPRIRLEQVDAKEFGMMIQGLAKIRELKRIANK